MFLRFPDDSNGFTLIEALLAILLLSVGLLGMSTLLHSVMGYNKYAETITTATTLAQDKMEAIKNTSFAGIVPETPIKIDEEGDPVANGFYEREVTVTPDATFSTNVIQITVRVSWSWKGATRDVELTTMIKK